MVREILSKTTAAVVVALLIIASFIFMVVYKFVTSGTLGEFRELYLLALLIAFIFLFGKDVLERVRGFLQTQQGRQEQRQEGSTG